MSYSVLWRNPALGTERTFVFADEAAAREFVGGRVRKYGRFAGFVVPSVVAHVAGFPDEQRGLASA